VSDPRRVRPKTTPLSAKQPTLHVYEFPKDTDGILYVRQSSLAQQQNNIHSFEMQTDKFLEYFRLQLGCTGKIEIVADDEAMSGTLDIHKRPGLSRVMKMIEQETIGWIGAVAVNRLTRDPWLVTPGTIMKECYTHNVWIVTLRMHFNFQDTYCQRVFMLEAEESARHLEWMKLIMGGARITASSNGYYDGRTLIPGYIVDRSDPRRKKYIIYEPHARIVRWLFYRYLELDGNFRALCKEVERMDYLFPKFEQWVDTTGIRRRQDARTTITPEGHYKPTEGGLRSILTNPAYIGWWLPLDGGVIENNHEPIVDEVLFVYAHKRLSLYDLNGERQKPMRVTRNGHTPALLKKVIIGADGKEVYPLYDDYVCRARTTLSSTYKFSVAMRFIEENFLQRFLKHVESIDPQHFSDWKEVAEQLTQARTDKQALILKQLKRADVRMQEIMQDLRDPDIPLTRVMKIAYAQEHAGLEQKKASLDEEPESDEEVLYEINTLIPDIVGEWHNLSFETRLKVVGALTRTVIIEHVAPSWIRMEVIWKLPEWQVDIAHIRRSSNRDSWTEEEELRLAELYPEHDAYDLLCAFPDRSWSAIQDHARGIGLKRLRSHRNSIPANTLYGHLSLDDLTYAQEHGLDASSKNVQWSPQVT
jgi:DNA invertase Pin-like site-specific DNA recombinase